MSYPEKFLYPEPSLSDIQGKKKPTIIAAVHIFSGLRKAFIICAPFNQFRVKRQRGFHPTLAVFSPKFSGSQHRGATSLGHA
jgi:hypothetical protein